jgi:hypothetical protein
MTENVYLPVNPDCDNVVLNWPCGCKTTYVRGVTDGNICTTSTTTINV